jgi:hypothetical protein
MCKESNDLTDIQAGLLRTKIEIKLVDNLFYKIIRLNLHGTIIKTKFLNKI